ncbi:uncharacterized protein F4822DRAFT_142953 [Hypoxylon trugodes]|uniref:uncharacterized protein n=1 Tax=Hypoxylon trugodes TaxID=326681 RepID=UPI00219C004F|nr:uncharacterized protein F4822DRAFT_142953 [Hypoxylon trugodes]KAI1392843.1 hypothetical protein F4822DRAFT_142953 [Hypoxylon trugodes]
MADFFYNINGKPIQNGHSWMLRSILYQILEEKQALYRFYQPCVRKAMVNNYELWKYDLLEEILLQLCDHTNDEEPLNFLFIIDGLDESEDGEDPGTSRHYLARLLSRLCDSKGGNIFHVIVLSRPEPSIKLILDPAYSIDMKNENHCDIERIIRYHLSTIYKRIWSDPGGLLTTYSPASTIIADVPDIPELKFMKDYILKHADGVILWVVLVLREIESFVELNGVDNVWELKKELTKFPTDLAATYEGMLERLNTRKPRNPQKSSYVFSWLLFSESRMTLCDMREVLAMFGWCDYSDDIRRTFLHERSILQQEDPWSPTWKQLSYICGGFIEIVPYEKYTLEALQGNNALDSDDPVQLIHRTAREFLLSRPESEFPGLNDTHGPGSVLTTCVDYMELLFAVDHHHPIENWNDLCLFLEQRPLLPYILSHIPTKLAVQTYKKNAIAIQSYKRIIEYIVKAWQIQSYPAIWCFERWEANVVFRTHHPSIPHIKDDSSFKFESYLDSIALSGEDDSELQSKFSRTLRALGRFGFNDTNYLQELGKAVLHVRAEYTLLMPDYVLERIVDEGAGCAIKFGYAVALSIFMSMSPNWPSLPRWLMNPFESDNPKIIRL